MRLGDLDALKEEVDTWGCNDYDKYDFIEAIDNAPTVDIIPKGDLISREALKKKAETITLWNGDVRRFVSYETIDNAPTVDIIPKGDLISREALKKEYALLMWKEHNPYDVVKVCDVVNQTLDFIDNAPTIKEAKNE